MTEEYMKRAIDLAKRGTGRVSPNPLVGAVIVKDGRILAEGYHACYGDLHAELSLWETTALYGSDYPAWYFKGLCGFR